MRPGLNLATVDKGESDSRTQLVQGPLQRIVIEKGIEPTSNLPIMIALGSLL